MSKAARKARKAAAPTTIVVHDGGKPRKSLAVSDTTVAFARTLKRGLPAQQVFAVPRPPPGVIPKGREPWLAMDQNAAEVSVWAAGTYASGWFDGPTFLGFPALSLLAMLPEYRRMAEILSTECTREWIRITCTDAQDKTKIEKVSALQKEHDRLDVRGGFRKLIELDADFGRGHLFVDVGTDPDDRPELMTSIGNGRDGATLAKFKGRTGFLRGFKPIEPVWCYPSKYNATNPLKDDWYAPQAWFCSAEELHTTRLLRFVGREVPDLLKPAYMFGGVSLSQLLKPYVDRWIAVVEAVKDIVVAFSTSGIATNLEAMLSPGGSPELYKRLELYNELRNNRGTMLLDKDSEEFFQFNVPLSELEPLMSKFQEFMCSVSGTPVVKLLGIQPAGLNASSQGELTSWRDWAQAYREKYCAPHLTTVIDFLQLNLWGEIDPDISWEWQPLGSLDPKDETERQKIQAECDATYVEMQAFSPDEIRQVRLKDPKSAYFGLEEVTPDIGPGPALDPEMAGAFPELAPPGEESGRRDQGGESGRPRPADRRDNPSSTRRGAREPADPNERIAPEVQALRTPMPEGLKPL